MYTFLSSGSMSWDGIHHGYHKWKYKCRFCIFVVNLIIHFANNKSLDMSSVSNSKSITTTMNPKSRIAGPAAIRSMT